eukprot:scaffold2.g7137.t1
MTSGIKGGAPLTDADLPTAAHPSPPAAPPKPNEPAAALPFSKHLWSQVHDTVFAAIMQHPFLVELAEGSLPEHVEYLTQDVLYLKEYGRALAVVASKAPRAPWTQLFLSCAAETYKVELGFHREIMASLDTSIEEATAAAVRSPNSVAYTSFMLARRGRNVVHDRAFYEGLAAVLPCFVVGGTRVYNKVGQALKLRGSRHPLYQRWIDQYGGEEFAAVVSKVVALVDEVALELGPQQRAWMEELFVTGCRWEWLFWQGAYEMQTWPV